MERKGLCGHRAQPSYLARERVPVHPRDTRIENLAWDTLDVSRDREIEVVKGFVLGFEEFAIMGGVHDPSGAFHWATATDTVFASGPTSVDGPAARVGFLIACGQRAFRRSEKAEKERRLVEL
ncbi:hypothetical protein FRB91_011592 [Serendipita sp. 411]|nr:hypothetical protein FRC19_000605 [Serendipita sp. 401]KAG8847611.1 hypothetical protein FRB91_011592 [Serendipita sp. 411]KAG9051929.1 hypothetical protein FS842_010813 [Serendipita sp. 407]